MTTPTTNPMTVDIELNIVNSSTFANPDKVRLVFDETLVKRIAVAQLGLQAMDFPFAEVTIPLPDDLKLFEEDEEWIQEERDSSKGDFEPSSTWLKISTTSLAIEIWDEHADDELHGAVEIVDIPGLSESIEAAKLAAIGEFGARLKA